jgi:hypothetical protein
MKGVRDLSAKIFMIISGNVHKLFMWHSYIHNIKHVIDKKGKIKKGKAVPVTGCEGP